MKIIKKSLFSLILLTLIIVASYGIYIQTCPVSYNTQYMHNIGVVFGAGITRSGDPSTALKFRLEKSVSLYKDQRIKRIFVSGRIAEAAVMKNFLLKQGVPGTDIIADTRGETTFVTVKNTKQYILDNGIADGPVFISQKYHIPRIIFIVNKLGIEKAEFIAAVPNKVDIIESSFTLFRETFAWIKNMIID